MDFKSLQRHLKAEGFPDKIEQPKANNGMPDLEVDANITINDRVHIQIHDKYVYGENSAAVVRTEGEGDGVKFIFSLARKSESQLMADLREAVMKADWQRLYGKKESN